MWRDVPFRLLEIGLLVCPIALGAGFVASLARAAKERRFPRWWAASGIGVAAFGATFVAVWKTYDDSAHRIGEGITPLIAGGELGMLAATTVYLAFVVSLGRADTSGGRGPR